MAVKEVGPKVLKSVGALRKLQPLALQQLRDAREHARKAGRSVRHGPVTVGGESAEFYFTIACKRIKQAGRIVKHALDDVRNGPSEPLLGVTPDVLLAVTDTGRPEWKKLLTGLRMEAADAAGGSNAYSADFRSVKWYGTPYSFTPNQASVVRAMWQAWEQGTPDVSDGYLLEVADSNADRLDLVFRGCAAWGTMIVRGKTKGTRRLAEPKS